MDVLGLVLGCVCCPASESDIHGGELLTTQLNDEVNFPRLEKILGDKGYSNVGKNQRVPVALEQSQREPGQKGFVPEAFRWVVERTFAWLNRQRRMVRNYEKNPENQESMTFIANIRLCLKKISKALQL